MELPALRLRKGEDRRLRAGHLWVFSNEVDVGRTPLTAFAPGEPAVVLDSREAVVGTAYVNPHSLICARLVSRAAGDPLDRAMLVERVGRALAFRERLFHAPCYRLVYGEGDLLPGLVVDRYNDVLVVQITTAGMERARDDVLAALDEVVGPRGVVLRNDTPGRALEGLELYVDTIGDVPARTEIVENDSRFSVPLTGGQKTGWFYDHRMNRARMRRYVGGRRVLDVFSYAGGWGVQAARAGAREVLCVDSSAPALEEVHGNAALNGVDDRVAGRRGDAFEVLRELRAAGERYDVVVLDPPAFIKRRKDVKQGERAYRKLNHAALEVLAADGVVISASCSYHMSRDALLAAILHASRDAGREIQLLEEGHQAADHPIHPAIPETGYLKAFFVRAM